MYVCMINSNSDDRQLKTEVAVFLDWSMTSDDYNCPSSSARDKERESQQISEASILE
jgi:hypothetical protein